MLLKPGKIFYFILSLLVTLLFLWLFLRNADWSEIVKVAEDSQFKFLLFSLCSLFIAFGFRLFRWKYILEKHNPAITWQLCFVPYFSSFALNNLLPFRLGDVARATLFTKHINVPVHVVVSSLMTERVVDLVSLLILFYSVFWFLAVNIFDDAVFYYIFVVSSVALIVIALFILFPGSWIKFLEAFIELASRKRLFFLISILSFVKNTFSSFYMHRGAKSGAILMTVSFAAWLFEAITFGLVGYSLHVYLNTKESIFVMSVATLATLLPSTPGYIGTYDYLCKLSLNLLGFSEAKAIGASLVMHFINLAPITFVGASAFIMHFGSAWKSKLRLSLEKAVSQEDR